MTFFYRRRSDLIIKAAVGTDSGRYECRAKNKLTLRRTVSNYTKLVVLSKHNPATDRIRKESPTNFIWLLINLIMFDYFSKTIKRRHEGVSRCGRKTVLFKRWKMLVHWVTSGTVMRVSKTIMTLILFSTLLDTLPGLLSPNKPCEIRLLAFPSIIEFHLHESKTFCFSHSRLQRKVEEIHRWVMWILRWSINNILWKGRE